jgi:iron complex transport system permease protein
MRRVGKGLALVLMGLAGAGAVLLSLHVGVEPLADLAPTVRGAILWDYRLPRALLAFAAGASLAASGACFQGLFRNPLADPFVVGVSGGASLGAVSAIVLGVRLRVAGLAAAVVAAFAGALGAALAAWVLARVRGRVSMTSLILAGSAIGTFCAALVSVQLVFAGQTWHEVQGWLMGNLGQPDPWRRFGVAACCLLVGLPAMLVYARDLNLLLLGEESAGQLGVEVDRARLVLLAAGALAAAGAVSVCGMIGFVGLVVPHVARRFVGPDHRLLLPVSCLGGGVFLALADLAGRLVSDIPLPVGAVTALLGAPFFVHVLRSRAGRG